MRIKITSVASEETIVPLNSFYVELEDSLNLRFQEESFGELDLFMFAIVSAYDDGEKNARFCKENNKSGSFVDPFTKQRVRFVSLAVQMTPSRVLELRPRELRFELCNELISVLRQTTVKIPKGFDFNRFSGEAALALEIYRRAE